MREREKNFKFFFSGRTYKGYQTTKLAPPGAKKKRKVKLYIPIRDTFLPELVFHTTSSFKSPYSNLIVLLAMQVRCQQQGLVLCATERKAINEN